jgi:hypothetical protein
VKRGEERMLWLWVLICLAITLLMRRGSLWPHPWLSDIAWAFTVGIAASNIGFGLGYAKAFEAMIQAQDLAGQAAGQRDRLAGLLDRARGDLDEALDAAERVPDADLAPIFARLVGALRAEGGPLSDLAHAAALAEPATPVRQDDEREAASTPPRGVTFTDPENRS